MGADSLTNPAFWNDPAPFAAGNFPDGIPDIAELERHVLFETSGSTGTPKWIALSKEALLASAAAVNAHLEVAATSCWGLALPSYHVGGFGVAARASAAGCSFREFGKRWNPAEFTTWLGENQVTHTSLVPTQVHDLVSAELRASESLIAIVVGGGRLDEKTGQAARELGWPVLASYGMTEAASQIATQTPATLAGIYQPAPIPLLPIWKAGISPEGKLRIAGPALFSGMLGRENGAWVYKRRESEWHQTEDRVLVENDNLTPLGRGDSLVKVMGELVDPEEIERDLVSLSQGMLAPGSFIIAAVPDARAEHALVPVFDSRVDPALVKQTLDFYQKTAPGFRRLKSVMMLDHFPRSPLGKPLRAEITARFSSNA